MSAATAIGMVSESLKNLLVGEFDPATKATVTVLAPNEGNASARRVNLFLYKVQENPTLKNLDWQVKRGQPDQLVPPPLSLNLFYLMTAYCPNDENSGQVEAHYILGDAMRVFYENPIVPSTYLPTGLQDAREQIRIMQNSVDMNELSQIWSTFSQPFHLSVLYEVSVVQLDMLPERERKMAKRVEKIGVPQLRTPFQPPVVEAMTPAKGPAGGVVTFSGRNLDGWKADVNMGGKPVVGEQPIAGDSFEVTLPGADQLSPGFYEVRVDVSHLFQCLFFFEVTLP